MIQGSCLCGGVRFELSSAVGPFELCHCNRCRKVSGSAFAAMVGVRTEDFRLLQGKELITTYEASLLESPPPYRTSFCSRCGSPVPDPDLRSSWFDGLRLDLWFHTGDSATIDPTKVRVVFTRGDSLQFRPESTSTDPVAVAQRLERQTQEFWRCIALLPAVIGRKELLTAFVGLSVETNLITDLLLTGYGIARDRGVKTLNQFLPPELRQTLEAALSLYGLSPASLTKAHLALARIVQQQGRVISTKHQFAYPEELEEVVLHYVAKELALLGLNDSGENE